MIFDDDARMSQVQEAAVRYLLDRAGKKKKDPPCGCHAYMALHYLNGAIDKIRALRTERDVLSSELEAARRVVGFARSFDRCWGEFADEKVNGKCLCDACNEYVEHLSNALGDYEAVAKGNAT